MPLGRWSEGDWQTLPGLASFDRPGSSSRCDVSGTVVHSGSQCLTALPRSSPLIRALSDVRRHKAAPTVASSSSGLPLLPDLSERRLLNVHSASGSIRSDAKSGRGRCMRAVPASDFTAEDAYSVDLDGLGFGEEIIDATEQALRKWAGKGSDTSIGPRYVIGGSSASSTSAGSFTPASLSDGSRTSSATPVPGSARSSKTSLPGARSADELAAREVPHMALDPDQATRLGNRLKFGTAARPAQGRLSLDEAVETLAQTNLPHVSAKDVVQKFMRGDVGNGFSENYFSVCHIYGTMADQVTSISKRLREFDTEDSEDEAGGWEDHGLALVANKLQAMSNEAETSQLMDRPATVQLLKKTLRGFESFHWDQVSVDMRRWVSNSEGHEAVLRDMMEQTVDQEREILSLLTLSRYLIEESLSVHLLSAARVLIDFHEKLQRLFFEHRRQLRLAAGLKDKDMFGDEQNLDDPEHAPTEAEVRRRQIRHQIEGLGELKERHTRQMEMNRTLYQHLVSRMEDDANEGSRGRPGAGAMVGPISAAGGAPGKPRRTVVVRADGREEAPKAADPVSPGGSIDAAGESKSSRPPSAGGRPEALADPRVPAHMEQSMVRALAVGKTFVSNLIGLNTEKANIVDRIRRTLRREQGRSDGAEGRVVCDDAGDGALAATTAAGNTGGRASLIGQTNTGKVTYLNAAERVEVEWLLGRRAKLQAELNSILVPVSIDDVLMKEAPDSEASQVAKTMQRDAVLRDSQKDIAAVVARGRASTENAMHLDNEDEAGAIRKSRSDEDSKAKRNARALARRGAMLRVTDKEIDMQQERDKQERGVTAAMQHMEYRQKQRKTQEIMDKMESSLAEKTHELAAWHEVQERFVFIVNTKYGPGTWECQHAHHDGPQVFFRVDPHSFVVDSVEEEVDELVDMFGEEQLGPLLKGLQDIKQSVQHLQADYKRKQAADIRSASNVMPVDERSDQKDPFRKSTDKLSRLATLVRQLANWHQTAMSKPSEEATTFPVAGGKQSRMEAIRAAHDGELKQLEKVANQRTQELKHAADQGAQVRADHESMKCLIDGFASLQNQRACVAKLQQDLENLRQDGQKIQLKRKDLQVMNLKLAAGLGAGPVGGLKRAAGLPAPTTSASASAATLIPSPGVGGNLLEDSHLNAPLHHQPHDHLHQQPHREHHLQVQSLPGSSHGGQDLLHLHAPNIRPADFHSGLEAIGGSMLLPGEGEVTSKASLGSSARRLSSKDNSKPMTKGQHGQSGSIGPKVDEAKIVQLRQEAQSKGRVLAMRLERKQQDLQRMLQKMSKAGSGKLQKKRESILLDHAKQMEVYNKQVAEFKTTLQTVNRMMEFWRKRFSQWHEEIRERYGEHVLEELDNMERTQDEGVAGAGQAADSTGRLPGFASRLEARQASSKKTNAAPSTHVWAHTADDPLIRKHSSLVSKAFHEGFTALGVQSLRASMDFSALQRQSALMQSGLFGNTDSSREAMMRLLSRKSVLENAHLQDNLQLTIGQGGLGQALQRESGMPREALMKLLQGGGSSDRGGDLTQLNMVTNRLNLLEAPTTPRTAYKAPTFGGGFIFNKAPGHGHPGIKQPPRQMIGGPLGGDDQGGGLRPAFRAPKSFLAPRDGVKDKVLELFSSAKLGAGEVGLGGARNALRGAALRGSRASDMRKSSKNHVERSATKDDHETRGLDANFSRNPFGQHAAGLKRKLQAKPKASSKKPTVHEAGLFLDSFVHDETEVEQRSPSNGIGQVKRKGEDGDAVRSRLDRLKWRRRRPPEDALPPPGHGASISMLKMFIDDVEQTTDGDLMRKSAAESLSHAAKDDTKLPRKGVKVASRVKDTDGHDGNDSASSSSGFSDISGGLGEMLPEEAVWHEQDEGQNTLQLLRKCRDRLVQRFGGIDKAYIRSAPAVTGMTREVFMQLTVMMGFTADEADGMFEHMLAVAPPRRQRSNGLSLTAFSPQSNFRGDNDEAAVTRGEFIEVMRLVAPVRTLLQLRARLLKKYPSIEAAVHAVNLADHHRGIVCAAAFRDFVLGVGVGASEARSLFMEIAPHCKVETLPGKPPDITSTALLHAIRHADGIAAGVRLRRALSKALEAVELVRDPSCSVEEVPHLQRRQSVELERRASLGLGGIQRRNSATQVGGAVTTRRNSLTHLPGMNLADHSRRQSERSKDVGGVGNKEKDGWVWEDLSMISFEHAKMLYDGFMFSLAVKLPPSQLITLDEFIEAVKPLSIPRGDIPALFRLADTGPEHRATLQDIIMRVLGGFGPRHDELRAQLGLGAVSGRKEDGSITSIGHPQAAAKRSPGCGRAATVKGQLSDERGEGLGLVLGEQLPTADGKDRDRAVGSLRGAVRSRQQTHRALNLSSRGGRGRSPTSTTSQEKPQQPAKLKRPTRTLAQSDNEAPAASIVQPLSGAEASAEDNSGANGGAESAQDHDSGSSSSATSEDSSSSSGCGDEEVDSASRRKAVLFSGHDEMHAVPARGMVEAGGASHRVQLELDLGSSMDSQKSYSKHSPPRKNFIGSMRRMATTSDLSDEGSCDLLLGFAKTDGPHLSPRSQSARTPRSRGMLRKAETVADFARSDPLSPFGPSLAIGSGADQDNADGSEAWAFKRDDDLTERSRGASSSFSRGRVSSAESLTVSMEERQKLQKETEDIERKLFHARGLLFNENVIELEIATKKLQQARVQLLKVGRGAPGRTFEALAGSRMAKLSKPALQDKFVRLLRLNSLDAERAAVVAMSVISDADMGFHSFLKMLRFATPVSSLLEFRARLVQRYKTIDAALSVLDFEASDALSVDVFERALILEGIVESDARRIFQAIDAVQHWGPKGFITLEAARFALDHAHAVRSLELFQYSLGGRGGARSALALVGDVSMTLSVPADLETTLGPLGFPSTFVEAVHKVLVHQVGQATKVKMETLLHILQGIGHDELSGIVPMTTSRSADAKGCAGPPAAVRDMALDSIAQLRRYIMANFANLKEAYDKFKIHRPGDGIALEKWEDSMTLFGFTDKEAWTSIFGHLVEWQHPRWDKHYRQTGKRVLLGDFASMLNNAAPVLSQASFKHRLQEHFSTMPKAWVHIAGKEGVEEVGLHQWHKAMQALNIRRAESSQLFAILRAIPCTERNHDAKGLSRKAFFEAMRGHAVEANDTLLKVLLRWSQEHGPASRAFEAFYPEEPLAPDSFREYVEQMLECDDTEVRVLFGHLDVHREGKVAIDDLLDALTAMQAAYLPQGARKVAEQVAPAESPRAEFNATGSTALPTSESGQTSAVSTAEPRPRTTSAAEATARSGCLAVGLAVAQGWRAIAGEPPQEKQPQNSLHLQQPQQPQQLQQHDARPKTSPVSHGPQSASRRPVPLNASLARLVQERRRHCNMEGAAAEASEGPAAMGSVPTASSGSSSATAASAASTDPPVLILGGGGTAGAAGPPVRRQGPAASGAMPAAPFIKRTPQQPLAPMSGVPRPASRGGLDFAAQNVARPFRGQPVPSSAIDLN